MLINQLNKQFILLPVGLALVIQLVWVSQFYGVMANGSQTTSMHPAQQKHRQNKPGIVILPSATPSQLPTTRSLVV